MNAPPFEMTGIGFLILGFFIIFFIVVIAIFIYLVCDLMKRIKGNAKEQEDQ